MAKHDYAANTFIHATMWPRTINELPPGRTAGSASHLAPGDQQGTLFLTQALPGEQDASKKRR
jgi:hypothetical protein